ncbi:iron-containing redox enzyme family protein [Yinghuangia sp. YIM S09857]|uniref:iron-containing redox enzyme family protein n=1 Tax=Yinghuangia sp. YIM S09857 TaxID=3436929 RepID=UPI003F52C36C
MSQAVVNALRTAPGAGFEAPEAMPGAWSEDLHLALYICYELHYRSFAGVDPAWEWDPDLMRVRARLESVFLGALRDEVGPAPDAEAALAPLLVESDDESGISHFLLRGGNLDQFREYVVHRSAYHLKEADPHALLIPRLTGRAKAGVVAVEFDEYGGGRAERMHSALFADLMTGLGLDASYGAYLDRIPAPMLATVNLMSLFAWHRGRRGMMAGHFAAAEATMPPSAARLAETLTRLGVADPACARFFTEHIEADAVHEQLMRRDVIGGLLREEPGLDADIAFGVRATGVVGARFADHLTGAWTGGRSSLRPAA